MILPQRETPTTSRDRGTEISAMNHAYAAEALTSVRCELGFNMSDPQHDLCRNANQGEVVSVIRDELAKADESRGQRITKKFVFAALGAIPWVGGFLAAAASLRSDEAKSKQHDLQSQWLEEHEQRLVDLQGDLHEITERTDSLGDDVAARMESEEYLGLVRQAFQAWNRAGTDDKRRYIRNLMVNSAGTRICSDDVVRLFIEWIDQYHEAHFAVIRSLQDNPGSTRWGVWQDVYGGKQVREDSAEADLYKLLIRDLSTGGVIRQVRDTNEYGQFVKKRPTGRRRAGSSTLESAFEDSKPYTLTELGKQFVHYTMNESVGRLSDSEKPISE